VAWLASWDLPGRDIHDVAEVETEPPPLERAGNEPSGQGRDVADRAAAEHRIATDKGFARRVTVWEARFAAMNGDAPRGPPWVACSASAFRVWSLGSMPVSPTR
jgi:hypothetical protein